MYDFEEFPKIARLKRTVVITEKIDGTNAQVAWVPIVEPGLPVSVDLYRHDPFCLAIVHGLAEGDSAMALYAGSRNRWLTEEKDNFGFARWVVEHREELYTLGAGRHYGEWYGLGIQRGYNLAEKRFALFNTARWNAQNPNKPACCDVVPVLAEGEDVDDDICMRQLDEAGSHMVPGFKMPEGIVVYHTASRQYYKRTFRDDGGKWKVGT